MNYLKSDLEDRHNFHQICRPSEVDQGSFDVAGLRFWNPYTTWKRINSIQVEHIIPYQVVNGDNLSPKLENIQFKPNDFLHLKLDLGLPIWRTQFDDPLPPEDLEKLATMYSEKLNVRLKIFLKGKKQGTFKFTILIVKHLLNRAELPCEFKEYRLNELEEELVLSRRCGRPPKNKIKITEKIKNQPTLINLLNKLVDEEIVIKTPRIEHTERSNPNKEKPNVYYSINPEIFRLSMVSIESEVELTNEVIYAKYRELENGNKILQKIIDNYRRMFQKNEKDLFAAKEILKERGISQPDDAISDRLSSNKVWA